MMEDAQIESEIRGILAGWTAPSNPEQAALVGGVEVDHERALVAKTPVGWLIVGRYLDKDYSGCRVDGVSLAHDMVRIATPVPPLDLSQQYWPGVSPTDAELGYLKPDPMSDDLDSEEPDNVASAEPFDAGPDLSEPEEITELEDEGGIHGPDSMVYGEAGLEADELALDGPSSDVGEEALAGGVDDDPAGDVADESDPAQLGGVLIREFGDALATAKAIALMAVDDERFARVGDYDKAENQARLDELRQIQQAIREGVHPAFTDEQTEELQALETFLPFMQRIDDYAQSLRDAIRAAGDLEVLTSIDILNGWPE